MRRKPTIHELEKILNEESPKLIRIYKDGSIGVGKRTVSYEITFPLVFFIGILLGSILW